MTKIALLLSGNLRTFFYKDNYIAKQYLELIKNQNIDLFIYTDNNDFNYNDIQYFSEKNKEMVLGISNDYQKRLHKNREFINYTDACKIINENLLKIFGDKIKKIYIEDFEPNQINKIYDNTNIYHKTFMENIHHPSNWKIPIMCQYYKLYKCYNLLCEYENEKNFKYDIIIKSRMEVILNNLNSIDIKSLYLTNKVYCYQFDKFISDTFAIGNRYIMDKYCNNYLYISPNLVEGTYCYLCKDSGLWKVVQSNNIESFWKEYNNKIELDASPGGEFGLTYIIKYKYNYDFQTLPVNEISFKFYDDNFFSYFSDK